MLMSLNGPAPNYVDPPRRVGVDILFYWRPRPCPRHTNYKAPPAQIFFWEACFLFPRSLALDFCYDLDLCSQGQAVRAFFIKMGFSLILSKVQEGF